MRIGDEIDRTHADPTGLVFIGRITRTHGVHGEVKLLEGQGSSGAWREAEVLYVGATPEQARAYHLGNLRSGGRFVILSLEGIDNLNIAEGLKGLCVYVLRGQLPHPGPESYYVDDLKGLTVVDTHGTVLGVLEDVFDNGAHEVYVVGKGVKEILIPVISDVVIEVDRPAGKVVVDPPEGLPGL